MTIQHGLQRFYEASNNMNRLHRKWNGASSAGGLITPQHVATCATA